MKRDSPSPERGRWIAAPSEQDPCAGRAFVAGAFSPPNPGGAITSRRPTPAAPAIFAFSDQPVRIVDRDGEPWFVLADVCRVLDIGNPSDVMRRLDADEKGVDSVDTLGGPQHLATVSEPGLYAVIGASRKPEAKAFGRWVRHTVLPSIRKHGGYTAGQELVATVVACSRLEHLHSAGVSFNRTE